MIEVIKQKNWSSWESNAASAPEGYCVQNPASSSPITKVAKGPSWRSLQSPACMGAVPSWQVGKAGAGFLAHQPGQ